MICDRKILQHGRDITCSVCFKSYHLKCISIDHVVIEYIEQNRSTWYCSHCLINIFPFKNLENEIDFMSTVNESPLDGSLIYLSDKIVSYVEYSLRIQIRIIYDFICAMCMGCDESCVCRRSGTEIHSAIVRHSIGFMFVWLNSCYQCGIWSMLSTETRPGDKINAVSADGLVPNFPTTGRHGIQYFLFHFMLTFAMYIV